METKPDDKITITFDRKTLKILINGFMVGVAQQSGGREDTGKELLRELETGKPLSQELITRLISHAVHWDNRDMAEMLAKAFRPDGELSFDECMQFVRRRIERDSADSLERFERRLNNIRSKR